MARRGDTLTNPLSGERFTFLRTTADTDGRMLAVELELEPGGRVPRGRVHPDQEKRFEVLEGRMRFRLGRQRIEAGPGDVVRVPRGKAHRFENAGDAAAVCRVEVTPALDTERLIETACELAAKGERTGAGPRRLSEYALRLRAALA